MSTSGNARAVKLRASRQRLAPAAAGLILKRKPRSTLRNPPPFKLPLSTTRVDLLDDGGATDHRFRQMLFDFSTLGTSLEIARSHLAALLGLSSPQYNIAMILANHQNSSGLSVSDMARRLHVSTAFITAEAGKLEQSGLVEKRPNPDDGRGVLLRLSPQGAALVLQVGPERQRVNDLLFRQLSGRAFRDLSSTLSRLIDDFADTLSVLGHGRLNRAGLTPAPKQTS
jgi:DNA-binding MarR family transcriptional regulator